MDKPSVVMVLLDALRADCAPGADESPHLRSLGLRCPVLPALTALVQDACHFTQAMSCAPVTTPCVGSIFTGLLPPEHGVRAFDLTALSQDVRTLAEILTAQGYATCAMTDQPPVLQPMGLLRGFQMTVPNEDDALAWWDSYAGAPRFLFLHLWDCHKPYNMPFGRSYRSSYPAIVEQWRAWLRSAGMSEPLSTELLDADEQRQRVYRMQFAWEGAHGFKSGLETYIAGLTTFDGGRLHDIVTAMKQRRMLDEAISVVLADHGEGRDRSPSWRMTHDTSLADDVMHIPLYVRVPGVQPLSISEQVSEVDVTPTLLDLLGIGDERTASRTAYGGRSLAPLMRGGDLPARPAYAEVSKSSNDPSRPVGQTGSERAATIHARVLRYPQRKYRLAGEDCALDERIFDRPPDEAVRFICRSLLGRIETVDDAARLTSFLQDGRRAGAQRLAALTEAIVASDEWRLLDKLAAYDLQRDPLETKPINPRSGDALWAEYRAQVGIMQAIAAAARPGAPLLSNEADEQVILKRLQDLGYVE